jgi:hypothetical protein
VIGIARNTHLVERAWPEAYGIEVLDSSGNPAALTEYGQKEAASRGPNTYIGSVFVFDLEPSEERSIRMNLAAIWQIKPGQAYTIKVKRTLRPVEEMDAARVPLRGELSATLEIPASAGANAQ